jgi:hypothetical protein
VGRPIRAGVEQGARLCPLVQIASDSLRLLLLLSLGMLGGMACLTPSSHAFTHTPASPQLKPIAEAVNANIESGAKFLINLQGEMGTRCLGGACQGVPGVGVPSLGLPGAGIKAPGLCRRRLPGQAHCRRQCAPPASSSAAAPDT